MDKIAAMDRGEKAVATAATSSATTTTSAPTSTSSPGLFTPAATALRREMGSKLVEDSTPLSSPYLHALQMHKVKE